MTEDPYAILGVDPGASPTELKKAWRKAARDHHPDRNPGDPDAESRFKRMKAAWDLLSDPERRHTWDRRHRSGGAGGLSEEFLDAFEDAIQRAESWFQRAVLPAYVARWGTGAALGAHLAADVDRLARPSESPLPAAGWWSRWRSARLLKRVWVNVDTRASWELVSVLGGRDGVAITLHPRVFWNGGFRDDAALDDAVLRVLLASWTAVLRPRGAPRGTAAAEVLDANVRAWRLLRWGFWLVIGALSAAMLYAGWAGRF